MGGFLGTDERRKAAKEHQCTACKQSIPKGAVYHYSSGFGDDCWWTWREHLPCHSVTQEWLCDEPDGLDPWSFGLTEVAESIGGSSPKERAEALDYFRDLGLMAVVEAIEKATYEPVSA